jgi:hypothetical protein
MPENRHGAGDLRAASGNYIASLLARQVTRRRHKIKAAPICSAMTEARFVGAPGEWNTVKVRNGFSDRVVALVRAPHPDAFY